MALALNKQVIVLSKLKNAHLTYLSCAKQANVLHKVETVLLKMDVQRVIHTIVIKPAAV